MTLATTCSIAAEDRPQVRHPAASRGLLGVLATAVTLSLLSVAPTAAAPVSEPVVTATIPVGTNPFMPVLNAAGTILYVPNDRSASISVIDTATNTVPTG